MKYISVCSGIEAATVAWHPLGWSAVAFSEVDPFPCAVLKHHYPDVPNLGDMTRCDEWEIPDGVDVLVGGTPCQSFSVAGNRGGMDDPRGQLAIKFFGIVRKCRPTWIVWENVPGVLSSSKGRDFGLFLSEMGKCGYGFSYRILDAQYFGVPQRRRRVFVVGYFGNWRPSAAVLFERTGLPGDIEKGKKKRKNSTRNARDGIASSLDAESGLDDIKRQNVNTDCKFATYGTWWDGGQTSQTLDAVIAKGQALPEKNRFPAVLVPKPVWIVCQEGCGDYWCNIHHMHTGDCDCPPIEEWTIDPYGNQMEGPAFFSKAFTAADARRRGTIDLHDTVQTLTSQTKRGDTEPCVLTHPALAVRRLTPRECERLQGFPDDYTAIPWRNKTADKCPDSPRYKAIGNSMAVPVMRWIGERIAKVSRIIAK